MAPSWLGRQWLTVPLWFRRQWPLLLLMLVLLAGDLQSESGLPDVEQWAALPSVFVLGALALAAPARPVAATFGAAATLAGWSLVLWLSGGAGLVYALDPLLASELAAVLAVVVAVVRAAPGPVAAVAVGTLLCGGAAAQLLRGWDADMIVNPMWDFGLPWVFLLWASVTAGRYLRARDIERDRATHDAVATAQHRERLALARELHDVVAHHVGGIVVQAQAAQFVAATDAGVSARILPLIETAGVDALSAMRRMVAALREGDTPDGDVAVPVTDLRASLDAVTATPPGGIPVRLTVELAEPVPAEVATSVLRLVQESVTNARRHATGAREIAVTVRTADGVAQVSVADDGRPAGPAKRYGGGFGVVGMRERVQLLGGRFSAGKGPAGGWLVAADVPLRATGL